MLGGTKIVLDQRDFSLTPHLAMDGFWESWITSWAMQQRGSRLLNIGANCGYYTLLFAGQGFHVVAVEPQVALADNIELSARLNGWSDRIRVERCVAGAEDRDVPLQLYPDFHGSAHVTGSVEEHPALAGEVVMVNERVAASLMPDATCVFVDAEGYEPLIWEGLQPLLAKRQLEWIALEWAPVRYADPSAFLAELKAYGRLAVVGALGQEVLIEDDALLSGTEWDTLVVRCA
jgi:FkbM family methyltransferase